MYYHQQLPDIGLAPYFPRYKKIKSDVTIDSIRPYDQENIDEVANWTKKDGSPAGIKLLSDGRILMPRTATNFDRTQVMRWRIKEEIFFDKKRSKMSTRIIGLCPVIPEFPDPNSKLPVVKVKSLFMVTSFVIDFVLLPSISKL